MGDTASERENVPIWTGEARFHESYMLLLSDPTQQATLMLGQTLVSPADSEPYGGLWAFGFDGHQANRKLVMASSFSSEHLRIDRDPVNFQVERGSFSSRAWKGRIESREIKVGWNLSWTPGDRPFRYLPLRSMYRPQVGGSRLVAPNPDLLVTGEILLDKRRVEVRDASAIQLHRWGSGCPEAGHWVLVPAFPDHPGVRFQAWVETGVSLGPWSPPFSVFRLTVDDRVYETRGLWSRIGERGPYDLDGWNFTGQAGALRITGQVEIPFNRRLGMAQQDPDGQWMYTYVCVAASISLTVERKQRGRWVTEHDLVADLGATFIVQTRDPDENTPILATLGDPSA